MHGNVRHPDRDCDKDSLQADVDELIRRPECAHGPKYLENGRRISAALQMF